MNCDIGPTFVLLFFGVFFLFIRWIINDSKPKPKPDWPEFKLIPLKNGNYDVYRLEYWHRGGWSYSDFVASNISKAEAKRIIKNLERDDVYMDVSGQEAKRDG